jgi:hypothetical protein
MSSWLQFSSIQLHSSFKQSSQSGFMISANLMPRSVWRRAERGKLAEFAGGRRKDFLVARGRRAVAGWRLP